MWKNILTKLASTKVWFTIVAAFLTIYIVVNKLTDFNNIAMGGMAVIISYSGVNILEDWIKGKLNK